MKQYIVYDKDGRILRRGQCSEIDFSLQAHKGEFVLEGIANDVKHKIVNGKVVNKTPEEIEADKHIKPKPIPLEQQKARITNEQYQKILDRLNILEAKNND